MEIASTFHDFWQATQLFFENVDVHELIQRNRAWFYTIAFVWAFLEGETFLIFAGAAAAQGVLDIKLLILAAWSGSMCGDQLYFFLGYRFGPSILEKFPKHKKNADKIFALIKKYGVFFILIYRFLWTVRNVCAFALGFSRFPWKTFAPWNAVAALIWACCFAGAGYFFGEALENVLGEIHYAMAGLVGLVALFFVGKWLLKKFKKPGKH
jgi:membrane protein DedA with SNARE-associated domain